MANIVSPAAGPRFRVVRSQAGRDEVFVEGLLAPPGARHFVSPRPTVTTKSFLAAVKPLASAPELDIYINSLGGSFSDGVAIGSFLRGHRAHTRCHAAPFACGAASLILVACSEVIVRPESVVVIHPPEIVEWGRAPRNRRAGSNLLKLRAAVVNAYLLARPGLTREAVEAWVEGPAGHGTWLEGEEVVRAGFADRVELRERPAA